MDMMILLAGILPVIIFEIQKKEIPKCNFIASPHTIGFHICAEPAAFAPIRVKGQLVLLLDFGAQQREGLTQPKR